MISMHTFKDNRRSNDAEEGMRQFSHDLSEEEIELLAEEAVTAMTS